MTYIKSMRHVSAQIIALTIAACLVFSPVLAENKETSKTDEGLSLLEQGAKLFMRGMIEEMGPALQDFKGMADEMLPMFEELRGQIGDFTNYHMPEVLPNGDIIIRRKVPLKVEPKEEGEIDL